MSEPRAHLEQRPTYADIEALPSHLVGEIIAGELVATPRPASPHARTTSVLGALLNGWFDLGINGPGGWWIIDEPELSLGVDSDYDPVVPDMAGWRRETMPEYPRVAQYTVVPSWICEVLSPHTSRRDRIRKVPFYARAGVTHVWLIDPIAETLEVFRLDGETYRLVGGAGGTDTIRAEPFDAMEIDLALLWPPKSRTDTD